MSGACRKIVVQAGERVRNLFEANRELGITCLSNCRKHVWKFLESITCSLRCARATRASSTRSGVGLTQPSAFGVKYCAERLLCSFQSVLERSVVAIQGCSSNFWQCGVCESYPLPLAWRTWHYQKDSLQVLTVQWMQRTALPRLVVSSRTVSHVAAELLREKTESLCQTISSTK